MNRSLTCIFVALFLFLPVSAGAESDRTFFVSVIQDPPVLESREAIRLLVEHSKKSGVKALYVQVYRSNQAWFPSNIADDTPFRECKRKVGEDPMPLLIREAHAAGIEVHAWMNLLSIGANDEAPILKKYGTEILTRDLKPKQSLEDYKIDNQFFLEPGDPRVRRELSKLVSEVLNCYPDLDGILFDYIRYPDWHPRHGHTARNVERFKNETGQKTARDESREWQDWKRKQVTELLQGLVRQARALRPGLQVSTTGLMPYSRAFYEASQDWRTWVRSGLIDFVTLMCYAKDEAAFEKYIEDARKNLTNLEKANIAVGAYSQLATPSVFIGQFRKCEEASPRACAVLHYGNLLENQEMATALESFSDITGQ